MPDPSPEPPSTPDANEPGNGNGAGAEAGTGSGSGGAGPPSWWSGRRALIGGGVTVALVAAVALGVYATPPGAYSEIGDCDELFAGFDDTFEHTRLDGVEIAEIEAAGAGLRVPDTDLEETACGGRTEEVDLIVDFTLYPPDSVNSGYEALEERLASVREAADSADGGGEDGGADGETESETLAAKDIEVGDEGFATLTKLTEGASAGDPAREESLLYVAHFRMSNIAVRVSYLLQDRTASPDEHLVAVTRVSESVQESLAETSEKA